MLALTRRADEAILIGDDIVVTVLGIEGGQVRIGIEAPSRIKILRDELVAELDGTRDEDTAVAGPGSAT